MKKQNKLMLILATILTLGMSTIISACSDNKPNGESVSTSIKEEKTLTLIKVTSLPTKTTYLVGEEFDKSGMVVVAEYSDGTSEIITDYTIDKTILAKDDTFVTISYKEKIVQVSIVVNEKTPLITFKDDEGNGFNFYNDYTIRMAEGTASETVIKWHLDNGGMIVVDVPAAISDYVSITVYKSNGNVYCDVNQSFGGEKIYSISLLEYKNIFNLDPEVVGRINNGDNSFVLYDIKTYEMKLNGANTKGKVNYIEATSSEKPQLELIPDNGDKIIASIDQYTNVFTILDTFVIADVELQYMLGNSIGKYETNDGDCKIIFFADGTFGLVINNGSTTEYGRSYCTYTYDNSDLLNLSLKLACAVPLAYGDQN